MDVYIVYAILMHGIVLDNIDPNDFKYVYIGLTNQFEERMYHHLRCTNDTDYKTSKKLYNRIRHYGWDAFDKIILESNLSECLAKERRFVSLRSIILLKKV